MYHVHTRDVTGSKAPYTPYILQLICRNWFCIFLRLQMQWQTFTVMICSYTSFRPIEFICNIAIAACFFFGIQCLHLWGNVINFKENWEYKIKTNIYTQKTTCFSFWKLEQRLHYYARFWVMVFFYFFFYTSQVKLIVYFCFLVYFYKTFLNLVFHTFFCFCPSGHF